MLEKKKEYILIKINPFFAKVTPIFTFSGFQKLLTFNPRCNEPATK